MVTLFARVSGVFAYPALARPGVFRHRPNRYGACLFVP
ncbi:hypothetical protein N185_28485 [Sinorhizobium sp. GW3]|nr:hypothetical protein N185_28485 [Sinorhizobium sp. GW3]